ncbi:MAG TPA: PLP-dependent transferase [Allosphingosinicella sp.]|nr:PLP-dependent transferase [Allosphingosinicella sp.]
MKDGEASTAVSRARAEWGGAYGAVTPPLSASDTYRWEDAETKPDYDYSRTVNPNRDQLSALLSELEGATGGVVTGSGQSAALLALLPLAADALVVAPHDCYGGTYRLLTGFAERGRIRAEFIDMQDGAAFEAAMAKGPALVWFETPSNPLLRLTDLSARAARARDAGARTLADNTLQTPILQRPLALGCDMVLHSTTKALNGHADLFGGALLAADTEQVETLRWWSNAAGINAGAFDAWQTLRGLRTLPLRIRQMQEGAQHIAAWLAAQEGVSEVFYPGLDTHPDHALARRQQDGPGFMLSFRLSGGAAAADRFTRALRLVTLAASLGGFSSLICRPATMTHRGMPPEAQARAGIHPDLLRLSVGLEAADDLIADLARGLEAATSGL